MIILSAFCFSTFFKYEFVTLEFSLVVNGMKTETIKAFTLLTGELNPIKPPW